MNQTRVVLFIVLFLLLIVFMMQNAHPVEIRFLTFRQSVPLIGVICILAFVGYVMGYLTGVIGGRRRWKKKEEGRKKKEEEERRKKK
jgi:uncharacterized integral membrane protein